MVLIFVQLFPSENGEEGKLEDELHSVFPPPSSTVCEQSKNIYAFGKECVLE